MIVCGFVGFKGSAFKGSRFTRRFCGGFKVQGFKAISTVNGEPNSPGIILVHFMQFTFKFEFPADCNAG